MKTKFYCWLSKLKDCCILTVNHRFDLSHDRKIIFKKFDVDKGYMSLMLSCMYMR